MAQNRVDIVYHAAAYKHVPLVEANPLRGVENNVFGTMNLARAAITTRSEEHTSELQSLMSISYAVFCLKKKNALIGILNTYIPYTRIILICKKQYNICTTRFRHLLNT